MRVSSVVNPLAALLLAASNARAVHALSPAHSALSEAKYIPICRAAAASAVAARTDAFRPHFEDNSAKSSPSPSSSVRLPVEAPALVSGSDAAAYYFAGTAANHSTSAAPPSPYPTSSLLHNRAPGPRTATAPERPVLDASVMGLVVFSAAGLYLL
ncbi:hypothetical protein GGS23DRAFT_479766 [Durotheca rogersii]|uniref:uncharacterized protein n=1 Tax=Durotheca rogersii TaxID=419775 RepID=UPI0022204AE2|nr:uncharacterized protein GGS23DRAFT_479766 [Durotheca rogersii]KAI5864045.1 hypothetical protein GGS23DRAFT_479766 [Durotheca rogersii]